MQPYGYEKTWAGRMGLIWGELTQEGKTQALKEIDENGWGAPVVEPAPTIDPLFPPLGTMVTKQSEDSMDLGNILQTGVDLYSQVQQVRNLQTPVYNAPIIPDSIEKYVNPFYTPCQIP